MRRLTLLVLALAVALPVFAFGPDAAPAHAETGSYWTGEYFTNRNLAGTPIHVRIDNTIAFDWGGGSPVPGVVPQDDFSVRWTGPQQFDAGTYTFSATVDDGVRVYIDDVLIIDAWYGQLRTTHTADYTLTAGTHWVRVEYFDLGDQAAIFFSWRTAGALNAAGGWAAEYYNNRHLNAPQVGGRLEAAIDYNWGSGSPIPGTVNANNFSVRWWGFPSFAGGTYQFVAGADDGVRVIVDATTVIDAWEPALYTEHVGTITLNPGIHTVRVEYFEAGDQARIQVYWVLLAPGSGGGETAQPTGATGVTATVATARLNVRTGPGIGNAIVTRINEGELYDVIGQNADGTWLQLAGPGFTGWSSASYLIVSGDLANVPVGDGSGGSVTTGGATGVTTVRSNASLRVRRGPSTNTTRVAEFAPGETATVIGRTADTSWLQIRLGSGIEGWVSAAFVSLQSGAPLSSVPITG